MLKLIPFVFCFVYILGVESIYSQSENRNDKIKIVSKSLQTVTYLPIIDTLLPLQTIHLVFHIIQDKNGNGNLIKENSDHLLFIRKVINHLNGMYSDLKPMRLASTSTFIKDSRVQFSLNFQEDILFHKDSSYFLLKGNNPQYIGGEALYKKYILTTDSSIYFKNAVHIFWCGKGGAFASGIGDGRYIIMSKLLEDYNLDKRHWWVAGWLAHELGHSLGLNHASRNDGCDDTPNHNDCWNGSNCSSNMMDYNSELNSLTDCQLQKIHFNLMKFNPQSNIHRALVPLRN